MSDQQTVVVYSSQSYSSSRTHYLADGRLSLEESREYPQGRPLASKLKNQLKPDAAKTYLKGNAENETVGELIVSTKLYDELGQTTEERDFALKSAVRAGVNRLTKELKLTNIPYVFTLHKNTDTIHAHVLLARTFRDEKSKQIKKLARRLPKELFETENGMTALTKIFSEEFEKRIQGLAPIETEIADEASHSVLLSDERGFDAGANLIINTLKVNESIVKRLTDNKTLRFTEEGDPIFVKRDLDGNATGSWSALIKEREIIRNGDNENSWFYTGNLREATKIVLVDSPFEALALENKVQYRDLRQVAFVALDKREVEGGLVEFLQNRIRETSGAVSFVWARGNDRASGGKWHQKLNGLDDFETQLRIFAQENDLPDVTVNRFAPSLHKSWSEEGKLDAIIEKIERDYTKHLEKTVDKFYPTDALEVAPSDLVQTHRLPIAQIKTLPMQNDVADGSRAFHLRQEQLKQNQEEYAEQLKQKKQDYEKRVSAAKQTETQAVKNVPVELVFARWGLTYTRKYGKNTWLSGDGEHKINVLANNRFADVSAGKSKRDDGYLKNISRQNAVNAAIYLSGGSMNYYEAYNWVKDNCYGGTDLASVAAKKVEKDKPVPVEIPAFDERKIEQVRDYLENKRRITAETISLVEGNDTLRAGSYGSSVFILRDFDGHETGYHWRSATTNQRGNTTGTSKELGWFYLGNPKAAEEIVLVEAPIEAMSYYDIQAEKDWSKTAVVAIGGSSLPETLITELNLNKNLNRVTVALNSDVPGQTAARSIAFRLTNLLPNISVVNEIPVSDEDWNDYLKTLRILEARQEVKKPGDFEREVLTDPSEHQNSFANLLVQEQQIKTETLAFWETEEKKRQAPEIQIAVDAREDVRAAAVEAAAAATAPDTPDTTAPLEKATDGDELRSETDDREAKAIDAGDEDATLIARNGRQATGWFENNKGYEVTREQFYLIDGLIQSANSNYPNTFNRLEKFPAAREAASNKYRFYAFGKTNLADLTKPETALLIFEHRAQEIGEALEAAKSNKKVETLKTELGALETRQDLATGYAFVNEDFPIVLNDAVRFELEPVCRSLGYDGLLTSEGAIVWQNDELVSLGDANHRNQVWQALSENKQLSSQVLADYPELQESHANAVARDEDNQVSEEVQDKVSEEVQTADNPETVIYQYKKLLSFAEFKPLKDEQTARYPAVEFIGGLYVHGERAPVENVLSAWNEKGALENTREVVDEKEKVYVTSLGKDVWELDPESYIQAKQFAELRRYVEAIERSKQRVGELREQGGRARQRDADKLESDLRFWQRRIDEGYPYTDREVKKLRQAYEQSVKQAISKGMVEPERRNELVKISPVFRTAIDNRERYEKGRNTSFANRSAAVDDSMHDQLGYKVKRQDGKAITDAQKSEIERGVWELEQVLPGLRELTRQGDITIAHTSGKNPFLRNAGGLYVPSEKTVSIGVAGTFTSKPIPSLGHELLGHWLDNEAGTWYAKEHSERPALLWTGNRNKRIESLHLSELENRRVGGGVIRDAASTMNGGRATRYEVGRLLKMKNAEVSALSAEEQRRVEMTRFALGSYWYQSYEVWARLVEQYVATKLAENSDGETKAFVSVSRDYSNFIGYWSAENFAALKSRVEQELLRRFELARNSFAIQARVAAPETEPEVSIGASLNQQNNKAQEVAPASKPTQTPSLIGNLTETTKQPTPANVKAQSYLPSEKELANASGKTLNENDWAKNPVVGIGLKPQNGRLEVEVQPSRSFGWKGRISVEAGDIKFESFVLPEDERLFAAPQNVLVSLFENAADELHERARSNPAQQTVYLAIKDDLEAVRAAVKEQSDKSVARIEALPDAGVIAEIHEQTRGWKGGELNSVNRIFEETFVTADASDQERLRAKFGLEPNAGKTPTIIGANLDETVCLTERLANGQDRSTYTVEMAYDGIKTSFVGDRSTPINDLENAKEHFLRGTLSIKDYFTEKAQRLLNEEIEMNAETEDFALRNALSEQNGRERNQPEAPQTLETGTRDFLAAADERAGGESSQISSVAQTEQVAEKQPTTVAAATPPTETANETTRPLFRALRVNLLELSDLSRADAERYFQEQIVLRAAAAEFLNALESDAEQKNLDSLRDIHQNLRFKPVVSTAESDKAAWIDFAKTLTVEESANAQKLNASLNETVVGDVEELNEIKPSRSGAGKTALNSAPLNNLDDDFERGTSALAGIIYEKISQGERIKDNAELSKLAVSAFGAKRFSGVYTGKDVLEAMEVAVNVWTKDNLERFGEMPAPEVLAEIGRVMNSLPTHTARTEASNKLQQFSTPPSLAFVAARAAGITESDIVLEPSAGNGGLAVWALGKAQRVITNEIDENRQANLGRIGFDDISGVNAQYLHSLLDAEAKPTIVLMNPPFSSSVLSTKNDSRNGFKHVGEALLRLEPGGRLVAVLGEGANFGGARTQEYWTKFLERYNVRANIALDEKTYYKYGTTFGTRLIVIDKTGTTPGANIAEKIQSVYRGNPETNTLEEILDYVEQLGNERRASRMALLAQSESDADTLGRTKPVTEFARRTIERNGHGDFDFQSSEPERSGALPDDARRNSETSEQNRSLSDERGDSQLGELDAGRTARNRRDDGKNVVVETDSAASAAVEKQQKPVASAASGTHNLLLPEVFDLSPQQFDVYQENFEELTRIGYKTLALNRRTVAVKTIPDSVRASEVKKDFFELINNPNIIQERLASPQSAETAADKAENAADEKPGASETAVAKTQAESERLPEVVPEQNNAPIRSILDAVSYEKNDAERKVLDNGTVLYQPAKMKGGQPHPAVVVESASLAAVEPPDLHYVPVLDAKLIEDGSLSAIQVEAIAYAGQKHEQLLPWGARAGYFIGDGTGIGKGRTAVGVALDNWNQGRKRVVWLSVNYDLLPSAERDVRDLGGALKVATADNFKISDDLDQKLGDSLLFMSYSTLIGKSGDFSRFEQLKKWLGQDGVIIFDEAHKAMNAEDNGIQKATKTGQAVVDLQKGEHSNPNWRIVYMSATGASEPRHLAYAVRSGLYGEGTSFANFGEFKNAIMQGGVSAMELVCRDMKAQGMYCARTLSWQGVDVQFIKHEMTPEQKGIYNDWATAWQVTLNQFEEASNITQASGTARGFVMRNFWAANQLGSRQMMTLMKLPTIIAHTDQTLREGLDYTDPETQEKRRYAANVILSFQNTGESRTKSQVDKAIAGGLELEDLDFSPRELLLNVVNKSFPIYQYEQITDEEGKKKSVLVVDENGKPVVNAEALELKKQLLDRLSQLYAPDNPLDQIVNYYGPPRVAEVTGRKKRLIRNNETGQLEYVRRAEEGVAMDKASIHEIAAFQNGNKDVALISPAATEGHSMHADKKVASKDKRRDFVLCETPWSAIKLMQLLGRPIRSNSETQPQLTLIGVDMAGEMRFLSTMARRLESQASLTKGDRSHVGDSTLLEFNYETEYGKVAAVQVIEALKESQPDVMQHFPDAGGTRARVGLQILRQMGFAAEDKTTGALTVKSEVTENLKVTQFLNRLMILNVDTQNAVFHVFQDKMSEVVARAKAKGIFDEGVQDIEGENLRIKDQPRVVYEDPVTKSKTVYYEVLADHKTEKVLFDTVEALYKQGLRENGESELNYTLWKQKRSNNVVLVEEAGSQTEVFSSQETFNFRVIRPGAFKRETVKEDELRDKYERVSPDSIFEAKNLMITVKDWWQEKLETLPEYETSSHHIVGGTVLPIWNRLNATGGADNDFSQRLQAVKLETVTGEKLIGVEIPAQNIKRVLRELNADAQARTPDEIYQSVMKYNDKVELIEGMNLSRTWHQSEPVLTLNNVKYERRKELENIGVLSEYKNFNSFYYLPNDETKGLEVLTKVLERFPALAEENKVTESASETPIRDAVITPSTVSDAPRMQAGVRTSFGTHEVEFPELDVKPLAAPKNGNVANAAETDAVKKAADTGEEKLRQREEFFKQRAEWQSLELEYVAAAAEIKIGEHGAVQVNQAGWELLSRLERRAAANGQINVSGFVESSLALAVPKWWINAASEQLNEIKTQTVDNQPQPQDYWQQLLTNRLTEFGDRLDEGIKQTNAVAGPDNGLVVLYIDNFNLNHELLHQAVSLGRTKAEKHQDFTVLTDHPAYEQAFAGILKIPYKNATTEEKAEEVAAFVWNGDADILGIKTDIANDYLKTFVISHVEQHGDYSFKFFEERTNENVEPILEQVRTDYFGATEHIFDRRGAQRRNQSETRAAGETVQPDALVRGDRGESQKLAAARESENFAVGATSAASRTESQSAQHRVIEANAANGVGFGEQFAEREAVMTNKQESAPDAKRSNAAHAEHQPDAPKTEQNQAEKAERSLPLKVQPHFYDALAQAIETAANERKARIKEQSGQIIWVEDERAFVEDVSETRLRERFYRVAGQKVGALVDAADNLQQQIDSRFRVPLDTLKRMFTDKQYEREMNVHGAAVENLSDARETELQKRAAVLVTETNTERQKFARDNSFSPEKGVELWQKAKEFALETRSATAFARIVEAGEQEFGASRHSAHSVGRDEAFGKLLKSETCYAKHREQDFDLRGKHARFFVAGANDKLISRDEFLTGRRASDREKDAQKHGWSVADVAEVTENLRGNLRMLETVGQKHAESVQDAKDNWHRTATNTLLPNFDLEAHLKPLTNYEEWVKQEIDPIARLKAHPLVQLVDAWSKKATAEERFAATQEAITAAKANLEKMSEIAAKTSERTETSRVQQATETEYLKDLTKAVRAEADAGKTSLAKKEIETKPIYKQDQLELVGEYAVQTGSLEGINTYFQTQIKTHNERQKFAKDFGEKFAASALEGADVRFDNKVVEHLFEKHGRPAAAEQNARLKEQGLPTENLSELQAEMILHHQAGTMDKFWNGVKTEAAGRAAAVTEQTIFAQMLGKKAVVDASGERLKSWHENEFNEPVKTSVHQHGGSDAREQLGKVFTEPLRVELPRGETSDETVVKYTTVKSLLVKEKRGENVAAALEIAGGEIARRRELSNQQIGRNTAAANALNGMIADAMNQQMAGVLMTGNSRRLLTAGEVSSLADSASHHPMPPSHTPTGKNGITLDTGISHFSDKLKTIETLTKTSGASIVVHKTNDSTTVTPHNHLSHSEKHDLTVKLAPPAPAIKPVASKPKVSIPL